MGRGASVKSYVLGDVVDVFVGVCRRRLRRGHRASRGTIRMGVWRVMVVNRFGMFCWFEDWVRSYAMCLDDSNDSLCIALLYVLFPSIGPIFMISPERNFIVAILFVVKELVRLLHTAHDSFRED